MINVYNILCEVWVISMKYGFVALSIVFLWIALIILVKTLNYTGLFLPFVGLILTVVLFEIGFGDK